LARALAPLAAHIELARALAPLRRAGPEALATRAVVTPVTRASAAAEHSTAGP